MNFKRARRLFEDIRAGTPSGSPTWISSTLGLAVSLHHSQPDVRADKELAAELYDELIAGRTNVTVLPQALLMRARLEDQVDYAGDKPDRVAAGKLYRRIRSTFPSSRQAGEATLYMGHAAAMSGKVTDARASIRDIEQWISDHPAGQMVSLQWELIGRLNMYPIDDPGAAVDAFIKAEVAGLPPMTQMDAYFWRIANLADRAGDRANAVRYFRRIIIEEPRSGYGYESQLRLKELGETPPPLTDPFEFMTETPAGGDQ